MGYLWTSEEDEYLRDHAQTMTYSEIAVHLGRSTSSVNARAFKLHIQSNRDHKKYTQEEIDFIDQNFGIMSAQEISQHLHKHVSSIRGYLARHQYGKAYENVPDALTISQLSLIVGRSKSTIRYWIARNNLPSYRFTNAILIKYQDLFDWMKSHPNKWIADECYKPFFSGQEWFK